MTTVPLSGTNIRLLSGVPFSNDYKNTRWFDTITDQTNYFQSKTLVHSMDQANFQRIEGKHFIAVNENIEKLWKTNYLMFRNTEIGLGTGWWYAFVTKLEYKQKNTTYVHFEIDVFQTWKFSMEFKPSYVIREHCPLWNADGSPVINTVDEGLDYGSEYDTVSVQNIQPTGSYKWMVILTKEPMHNGSTNNIKPSVVGMPQPLCVYLVPFRDNNTVPNVYLSMQGVGGIISKPTEVLKGLYTDTNAVNNVVSIYITDFAGIPVTFDGDGVMYFPDPYDVSVVQVSDGGTAYFNCLMVNKIEDFGTEVRVIGNKYDNYKTVKESKLLMYPYTQLTLDDFKGNRVMFKNEYIFNPNIILLIKGSLGHSNKTSYGIQDYNYNSTEYSLQGNMSDEHALINNEPNDVPILTDMLAAYIQGNRNSLQVQKQSILWNGSMNAIGGIVGGVGAGLSKNPVGVASAGVGVVQGIGNTVLEIQAMQAKKQDIANTPSQIAKMGSNTSYTIGNNFNGLFLIKKQIKSEYRRKLEHFFNMFGYKINEVKIPNFHTRQYWNYVQTSSCTITGNFNNEDLQKLKSVFDNGITFWHTDDVGNYSLDNEVI